VTAAKKTRKLRTVELLVVEGKMGSGLCIYLNARRVAGEKPWGGGRVLKVFSVLARDVREALSLKRA
jgi:hypothetical protein